MMILFVLYIGSVFSPCPAEPGYACANSVDPDQLASEEASWSGSALPLLSMWICINNLKRLKIRSGRGILINSAWQRLIQYIDVS